MFDFVTIDFETANRNLNSACSVGITAVTGCQIVKKESLFIKPPSDIFDPINIEIHGITYDDVINAPIFPDVWNSYLLDYFCNTNYIIAHNAQFDMSVLKNCFDEYDIFFRDFLYIDNMNIVKECSHNVLSQSSLSNACNFFDVPLCNHHNALCDAQAISDILLKIIETNNYANFHWLQALNNIKVKRFSEMKATKTLGSSSTQKKRNVFNNRVKISDLSSNSSSYDENHPFFGKSFVFTGDLQTISRKDAMQIVLDLGGIVKSTVSKKTNYLIVGLQDKSIVGDDGLSGKEEKAYSLINQGINISILNENEFLSLL
ncbi:MAG: exonuclease domain-containing protein [Eubacterium aggregans]|uniref:exonuclease domain-containing protein n=1 Tax=Eubacterium aggregans TaxID=81409 RepID=UPI002B20DBC8|nr:exonuclease domain-containing protein [Eubacterium aggregans]MEA5073417.1 exonuclease domain-containing protein [Eubacterium aggregans]